MFIDKSYCNSDCINTACLRHKYNQLLESNTVVPTSADFSVCCNHYLPLKPKRWEPQEGSWTPNKVLTEAIKCSSLSDKNQLSGLERNTEEQAESLRKLLRRTAQLHALVCELDGEKKFTAGEGNYFLYKSNNLWEPANLNVYYPDRVYMTKECADKICEMIKTGEVIL